MGIKISVKKEGGEAAAKPAETAKADVQTKPAAGAAAITKKGSKAADVAKAAETAAPTQTAKATVSKATKEKSGAVTTEVTAEDVAVPAEIMSLDKTDAKKLAHVGVDSSYTHGLPNYSSVKVGVSLELPCMPSQINQVYDYASTWVSGRLTQMMKSVGAMEDEDGEQEAAAD